MSIGSKLNGPEHSRASTISLHNWKGSSLLRPSPQPPYKHDPPNQNRLSLCSTQQAPQMRPGSDFLRSSNLSEAPSIALPLLHSAWHCPVPNLFGGFAAMLLWIGLVLLTLACSYSKLNSFMSESPSDDRTNSDRDVKPAAQSAPPVILHQPFVVVMAGEENPTFIAIPSCSRTGLFDCVKGDEKAVQIVEGRSVAPALEPE